MYFFRFNLTKPIAYTPCSLYDCIVYWQYMVWFLVILRVKNNNSRLCVSLPVSPLIPKFDSQTFGNCHHLVYVQVERPVTCELYWYLGTVPVLLVPVNVFSSIILTYILLVILRFKFDACIFLAVCQCV